MAARILLVEDEVDLRDTMIAALASDDHRVVGAGDGAAALDAVGAGVFDVVLLDVGLGAGSDGIEVCRRLRVVDDAVYVIMLTARDAEQEVVTALEAARTTMSSSASGRPNCAAGSAPRCAGSTGTAIPAPPRCATRPSCSNPRRSGSRSQGSPSQTTRSEFAILGDLLRADGAVRSRRDLFQAIYGDDAFRDPRGIDVHVHHVRTKLADAGAIPVGW